LASRGARTVRSVAIRIGRSFWCAQFALLAAGSIACASGPGARSGAIEVRVRPAARPGVVLITLLNSGNTSVRVSPTFGHEDLYLFLEIEAADQPWKVEYPARSQFDSFSRPRHVCVDSAEALTLEVDLSRWYFVNGGIVDKTHDMPQKGPFSFDLRSGRYRVRAVYRGVKEDWRRCPAFSEEVRSEWAEVEVS
jgi:hypothetical protein